MKTKYKNQGQVMPFCLLLIVILTWVIYSNFEIGYVNFKKAQQQKEVDQITLDLATQFSRGYNEIAVINEGLEKIRNRGVIVALATAAAHYCAAYLAPPCLKFVAKMDPKLIDFYTNLSNLSDEMVKDQEAIQKWMLGVYCNKKFLLKAQFRLALYPRYTCSEAKIEELPLVRTTDEDFDGIQKCKKLTINSYEQFQSNILNLYSDKKNSDLHVTYENFETKKRFSVAPKNFDEASKLPSTMSRQNNGRYLTYFFKQVNYQRCEVFTDIMADLGGIASSIMSLKGPLVFTEDFAKSKNRFIALAAPGVREDGSPFEKSHGDLLNGITNDTWSVSESKILGTNLAEMEFKPRLNAISLQKELDEDIEKHPPLSSYFFTDFPKLSEIANDIHH